MEQSSPHFLLAILFAVCVASPATEVRCSDSHNGWLAEDKVLIEEKVEATSSTADALNVLDLVYRLTAKSDLTISRRPFSGFSLRVRKAGNIRVSSSDGVALLPNPIHTKPESHWPDAPWYACEQTLTDGAGIGAAVMSHPANPPKPLCPYSPQTGWF